MNEFVSIATPEGKRRGVLAIPDAPSGPLPGVVVIHDITGLRPDTRRHCERFEEAGYAAIAPDLFDGGAPRCVVQTLISIIRGRGQAFELIKAARQVLADRSEVDARRIGITGFCMGGGFALLAAADGAYAVAAPFYGTVPKHADRLRGICPTLAQYGSRDTLFLEPAARLSAHLEALGVSHEVLIHEGVGHSFMNDHEGRITALGRFTPLHAAYDGATEALAWEKLLDFFAKHMPPPVE